MAFPSSSSWRHLKLSLGGRGRASYFQVIEADNIETREIASFVPVKQPMSTFARNLSRRRYIQYFSTSFLFPHFSFYFSFTLFPRNIEFRRGLSSDFARECWRDAVTRSDFITLLHGWKSINRLKLSRDILDWITLGHIGYSISWIFYFLIFFIRYFEKFLDL